MAFSIGQDRNFLQCQSKATRQIPQPMRANQEVSAGNAVAKNASWTAMSSTVCRMVNDLSHTFE